MSLVGLAMRMAAVRALQSSQTLAGSRVFDSAIMPIDQIAGSEPAPFISISTEDETSRPSGRDLNNGDRTIDFVVEIAMAQTVTLKDEEGDAVVILDTDANLEMQLAILMREVTSCLFGRGGGTWGEAFRAFVKTIEEHNSRRGIPTEQGQRFAARQSVFRVKAYAEPAFAKEPEAGSAFAKFLAAAEADAATATLAGPLRAAIEGKPVDWPAEFTRGAVDAGMTEDEAAKIGVAPLGGYPSDPLEEIVVEGTDGILLDQGMIDTALPPEDDDAEPTP